MSVSSAVAQREQAGRPAVELRSKIEATGPEFARALPAHMTVDHFVRNALTLLHRVPKLAECEHGSVVIGLLDAARLGLEISDQRGQAYLIPRWDSKAGCLKAAFQTGYRGDIDLAARAGITVTATEIRELDYYDIERGTQPRLIHKPPLGNRGEIIGYYAVATAADGRTQFEVMSVNEVREFRDRFASQRNKKGEIYGPWVDDESAMARKTLIRKVLNYMPQAIEFRKAVAIETDSVELPTPSPLRVLPAPVDQVAISPPANVDVETGEVARDVSPQSNNPAVIDAVAAPVAEETDATKAKGNRRPAEPKAETETRREGMMQGEQTPTQMISELAKAHGVDGRDEVARMCSQIVGRDVVSPTDLKPPEVLKVRRTLMALGEDEEFEFSPEIALAAPVVEAEASEEPQPVTPPGPKGSATPDPETWNEDEWRKFIGKKGIKGTVFAKAVAQVGRDNDKRVHLFEEIAGSGIAADLVGWCEENAVKS